MSIDSTKSLYSKKIWYAVCFDYLLKSTLIPILHTYNLIIYYLVEIVPRATSAHGLYFRYYANYIIRDISLRYFLHSFFLSL